MFSGETMEVRRRFPASTINGQDHPYYEIKDKTRKRVDEALGFRHWLLLLVIFGITYTGVVYLHRLVVSV